MKQVFLRHVVCCAHTITLSPIAVLNNKRQNRICLAVNIVLCGRRIYQVGGTYALLIKRHKVLSLLNRKLELTNRILTRIPRAFVENIIFKTFSNDRGEIMNYLKAGKLNLPSPRCNHITDANISR